MDPQYESVRHTNLLIEHLEALERREIDRLAVHMPPRHSKTYHVSERLPAWYLGRNPSHMIILASYGSDLAETNSRKVRGLLLDERWPFATRVASDSAAVNRWSTSDGGQVLAAGVMASATGHGANFLCIDDPFKDRTEADSALHRDRVWTWYTDVARTRLMPRAVQLVTSTRWHDDDLAGRILNSSEAKRWTVLTLPAVCENEHNPIEVRLGRKNGDALWPAWYPVERLTEQREAMGSRAFASLYQQSPVPETGNLVKSDWLSARYQRLPAQITTIAALDAATKTGVANDFSVIVVLGIAGASYYVLDVIRRKVEYPDLRRMVEAAFATHHPSRMYVEDAANGTPLIQTLRRETRLPIVSVIPRGSKIARFEAVSGSLESRRVLLPEDAPWLDAFIPELLRFPLAPHDDQVDALTLALAQASRPQSTFTWGALSTVRRELPVTR